MTRNIRSFKPSLEVLEDRIVPSALALTLPSSPTVVEGNVGTVSITASGGNGHALTFSASHLPQGETINPSTGAISGQPAYVNAASGTTATIQATISVTDGTSIATGTLPIKVADTNRLMSIGTQFGSEGSTVSLYAHGTDLIAGDTLSYSASGLPAGLSINAATGSITGTIGFHNATNSFTPSTFLPTVTLTDQNGGEDFRGFTWSISNTDVMAFGGGWNGSEGSSISFNPAGLFAPSGLTWSGSGLPQGATVNPSTGMVGGIAGYANTTAGITASITGTVSVADSLGVFESRTFVFTITNTNRLPSLGEQADAVGQTVSLDAHGTDNTGTNTLTYSASGLPGGLSINASSGLISGTVATTDAALSSVSTYMPTLTLNDNHGGTDTRSLTWVISNPSFTWSQSLVAAPSITNPGTQNNSEGDTVSLAISATDPNAYTLQYVAVDLPVGLSINTTTGLISGTISYQAADDAAGTYTPVVIVEDSHGASTSQSFAWNVTNTFRSPTLTNPGAQSSTQGDSVSLQVSASDSDGIPLFYDATDLPAGLTIDPTAGLISGTIATTAGSPTPYAVTLTADAGLGGQATQTFNWTVGVTNHAPVLSSPGNQVNAAGDFVDVGLSASDSDGDALAFSATGLPAGVSIDPGTGEITGTIANSAASGTAHTVTVAASDGQAAVSQTFAWLVNSVGLSDPGDQYDLVGDTVSLALSGNDASSASLTWSATNLPAGLSLNASSGLIAGTVGVAAVGDNTVTLTASDGTNSANDTLTWYVARLALNPPADTQNRDGDTISLQLGTTDVSGTPSYSAVGLPSGLSLNATTGLISGTIGMSADGSSPYQVSVTASDGSASDTESFVWTVTPAVAVLNPGAQANAAGDSVSLVLTGGSSSGTLTFSAAGMPSGVSINASTGLISGTLGSGTAQTTPYAATVTASNGTAASSVAFSWSVVPLLLSVPDQSNMDDDSVSLALNAHYHGTATLSYSASGLPTGLTLNSSTGVVSGTLPNDADTSGPYSDVTVTATAGTLTVTQTFEWDIAPRVSVDVLDDQSNVGGDTVSLAASAEDAASSSLTYSATGLPAGLSMNASTGLITGTISASAVSGSPDSVTVSASDGTASASQTFSWSVAPLGLLDPSTMSSVKGQSASLSLQASVADGGTVTWSATGLPAGLTLNTTTGVISGTATTLGAYLVGVTTSEGTHSVSQTFEWDVEEVGLSNPGDQTSQEGATVSLSLQGVSGSGASLSYSASDLPDGLSLNASTGLVSGTIAPGAAEDGPFVVTADASDGTANNTQQFTWTVNSPVAVTIPVDQNNKEGDSVSLALVASDADSGSLSYSTDGLPAGLSINPSTGLISGTVSVGDALAGPYEVAVTASDGTYSDSELFNWTVTPSVAPAAPVVSSPGFQSNQTGDAVAVQVQATDSASYTLNYNATGLPDGLSIDSGSGLISGTVADDAASTLAYQITVAVDDGVGETTSQTFAWLVNPSPITLAVSSLTATAGMDTGAVTLGTFTTPDLNSQASDFTATVVWGDGTSDQGTISGQNGSFVVTDDHTYEQTGSLAVSISVADGATGGSAAGSTTANVAVAPWTLSGGFEQGVLVGQSSNLVLGTLTDSDPNITASNFSVQIDPGDGSGSVAGTVTALGDGEWIVSLSHAYSQEGIYTATMTVTGPGGTQQTATSTAAVGPAVAGEQANLTVATFTVNNPLAVASSYTATINWGDGSSNTTGTVTGSGGVFTVTGSHTYTTDSIDQPQSAYTVTVTLSGTGCTMTSTAPVIVVRPQSTVTANNVVPDSSGNVSNAVVAVISDPNAIEGTAEFQATINWGDGSSSSGTIVGSNGLFEVEGSHSYTSLQNVPITVQVSQGWSSEIVFAVVRAAAWVVTNVPVTIESLDYPGRIPVYSDSGVSGTPWVLDGLSITTSPSAFVRGSQLDINATFQNLSQLSPNWNQLDFTGVIVGNNLYDAIPVTLVDRNANGTFNLKVNDVVSLPNYATSYEPLRIYWFSSATGYDWYPAGVTSTPVYVLYGQPSSFYNVGQPKQRGKTYLPIYQTVVAYGSRGGTAGNNSPATILSRIWQNFASLQAQNVNGTPLTYYKNWPPSTNVCPTLGLSPDNRGILRNGMLQSYDGQCGAWAQLLYDAIETQGLPLDVNQAQIVASGKNEGFLVGPKLWHFGTPNNAGAYQWQDTLEKTVVSTTLGPGFDYRSWRSPAGDGPTYAFGGATVPVSYLPAIADGSLLVAQNNGNPYATFYNHVVVQIGTKYYDPSYGAIYSSLQDLQTQAIAGFFLINPIGDGTMGYTMSIRKPKIGTLQLEVRAVPPPGWRPRGS